MLRGDGLVLRPWRAEDAPAATQALADPAIRQSHVRMPRADEAPGWVAERVRRWSDRVGADWAVAQEDEEAAVLGRVAIRRIVLDQGLGAVAYRVLPAARGRRAAPRALALMGDWGFGLRGMLRLEPEHSVANAASCRLAERAGLALEGVKRAAMRHADGCHDLHLHARPADD